MRDFSWKYFSMTGDVDAYLLYKEMMIKDVDQLDEDEEPEAEPGDWVQ
ncbi:hypothetical protein PAESOLCIP111_00872 [Paenibacillus solanacearum]|uniref:YqzL family protein n=1 Tax=Paenibacillus solanacearum TaxID=2048548 RepID=A0A916JV27_9BACL|nr:YqzL family protein [Paenibacillus solanacearum]CAG7606029.1 hypothetical protein PAESOLCIP111_00872 [Paenibacillus solanacearum]